MTKEDIARKIAKKHEQQCEDGGANYHTDTSIINAMQEYADQETKELQERVEERDKQLNYCHKRMGEAYSEIHKLQSKINELEKANEWISVDDRFPDEDISVFCYTNVGGRCTCFYKNGNWRYQHNSALIDTVLNITHWKPLPQAPTNK